MRKRYGMNKANSTLITLFVLFHAVAAQASLGGDTASVEADRVQMHAEHSAKLTTPTNGSYTVHETLLPAGTLVKQYVPQAGVVFAVSWYGPFIPNLRQLLGTHFEALLAHQKQQAHAGHRFVSQHEPGW